MKRMLFNATQAEELRVAIVDGQKLIDLDIESVGKEQRKSNIYKGVITRVEPSLEACFVDYGCERHGFLPFKEIARSYLADGEGGRGRVLNSLREGQELIVQVEKDERGNKGAALTTYISLAGRYLVLMPNNPRGGGVSRRIEGEERNELRAAMDELVTPPGTSLIARTAAIGRNAEELNWDLKYLLQLWTAIEGAAQSNFGLIYQESSLVIRAIRDYFQPDIGEILIDTESIYEQAQQFMSHVMPNNVNRVKLYKDDVPLFSRFQIEHQIETAYSREVALPSGGAIVIDRTEALWSIDVNSARATKGHDIEETAARTNMEAADEIARQLRLRDMGGLVVIDFIDMENPKNQRDVENRVRDALHHDRARVQTGKISRFGLMELSRQRLQPSLEESSHIPCPRCHGTGFTRGIESSALHILRIIQEEAMKDNTGAIHAQVPIDVATFLLNEKRAELFAVEDRLKVSVILIPNMHLETPNYTVNRLRLDEVNLSDDALPSYRMVEAPAEEGYQPNKSKEEQAKRPEAVVKGITPSQPAPISARDIKAALVPSLWARIVSFFKSEPKEEEKPAARGPRRHNDRNRNDRSRNRNDRNRNERTDSNPEEQARRNNNGKPRIEEDLQPKPARERNRNNRGNRGDRQERAPRNEEEKLNRPERDNKPNLVVAAPQENVERNETSEPRRRRRRRGEKRDRNEVQQTNGVENALGSTASSAPIAEITAADVSVNASVAAPAAAEVLAPAASSVVVEAVASSTPAQVSAAPSSVEVVAVEAAATAVEPAAAPIAEVAAVNNAVEEVAIAAAAAEVSAPAPEAIVTPAAAINAPVIKISTPEEAGLEMVATRATATNSVEPVVAPTVAAPRRRRDAKKAASAQTEAVSLQLVETQKASLSTPAAEDSAAKPVRTRRNKTESNEAASTQLEQVETKIS